MRYPRRRTARPASIPINAFDQGHKPRKKQNHPTLTNKNLYDVLIEGEPHSEAITYDAACWIVENARRLGQQAKVRRYHPNPNLFESLRSDPEEARRIWKSDRAKRTKHMNDKTRMR